MNRSASRTATACRCSRSATCTSSYGQVEAVRGVEPGAAAGPDRLGDRPERRRQDDAARRGDGPAAVAAAMLRFEGEDLRGLDVEARVERGLCLVPEKRELFGELTRARQPACSAPIAKRLGGAALKRQLDVGLRALPAPGRAARAARRARCRAASARCSRSAAR